LSKECDIVNKREMILGFSLPTNGSHKGGWRHPQGDTSNSHAFPIWKSMVTALEAAKIHFMFLADGAAVRVDAVDNEALSYSANIDKLEPITLLSAISVVTERLGLVATASTTWNEPYTVARKFASLDHLSAGRAAWNVVTSWSEHEARNFGHDRNPDHSLRYSRAEEFVDIVFGLWDGWEDDAFIRDKASGQYFDPKKLHDLNYKSDLFSVQGPLNIQRPLQGYPVIAQAGSSEPGQELGARVADMAYTSHKNIDTAKAFYASLKSRLPKYGRKPDDLHVILGYQVIIGSTEQEAAQRENELQELIHFQSGMNLLRNYIPIANLLPIDEQLPDIEFQTNGLKHSLDSLVARARKNKWTVRQICNDLARGSHHNCIVGTPEKIADQMEQWFLERGCDGFTLQAPYFSQGVYDVLDGLLPELRKRGLFQTEYRGDTFRENLGLERPANQFTDARKSRMQMALRELSKTA
jgi:FMN-dependent oxidoreductase (nitrilotriacetate monooxygenase family)